jgi:hypothetical protein
MNRRLVILISIFIVIVTGLSLFDYFLTRQQSLTAGPTLPVSIELANIPSSAHSGQPVDFVWRLNSATPRTTDFTTVYWAGESSPSALTAQDSPAAVGYANYLPDYVSGSFDLPSDFTGAITFSRPQTIYFRYYSHVDNQHLWSPEYQLQVN